VNFIDKLRIWWQTKTGEEETPFDGDAPAWVISMIVHAVGLILVALISIIPPKPDILLMLEAPLEDPADELELPEQFNFSDDLTDEIGAAGLAGVDMALAQAPVLSDVSDVANMEVGDSTLDEIEINDLIKISTGPYLNENLNIKGVPGVGTTGAMGAVDRITHEILLSLQERKTLVVWMFDQSGSLLPQRKAIHDRFDRIYEELGVIEAAGNPAFAKHDDKPLLTAVVAFGKNVTLRTKGPTDDLAEIKAAVAGIEQDDSGIEKAFSSVYMSAERFKSYCVPDTEGGAPDRNVMLVVFCDEAGDDMDGLEHTIQICQRYSMPVYVVGVPALFGRKESLVKWVDPDPTYDQTPQWGRVNQGPESFLPERLHLAFSGYSEDKEPIDSGFGPFALTRLCYDTGGIYFAVHPNRTVHGTVSKRETDAFSAHVTHFFDPQIMRRYRPDYVSRDEYGRRLKAFPSRHALVKAADISWNVPLKEPRMKFVRKSDGALIKEVTEAQKAIENLHPKIEAIYRTLAAGEEAREMEAKPRWQAGYDLAMGRALAAKVRTDGYHAMLALAISGKAIKDPKSNHFELVPSTTILDDPVLVENAKRCRFYLNRVIEEHPDTPWALLARRELDEVLGWDWKEWYKDLTPRRVGVGRGRGAGGGGGGGGGGAGGGGRGVGRGGGGRAHQAPAPKPRRAPPRL